MEIFSLGAVWHSDQQPYMTLEELSFKFYLTLISLNWNSLTHLLATEFVNVATEAFKKLWLTSITLVLSPPVMSLKYKFKPVPLLKIHQWLFFISKLLNYDYKETSPTPLSLAKVPVTSASNFPQTDGIFSDHVHCSFSSASFHISPLCAVHSSFHLLSFW